MARDGLLPPVFSRIHPRFRTPYVGTILTGVFVASISSFADISDMVDLTNIGTLFAFILVCAGIIVLRVKDPARERPFRVPSGWLWTLVLYAAFTVLVVWLPLFGWAKLVILGAAALVFAACRKHIFPVLGILSCLYLVYYLPPNSWLRFTAWLNCGFVIYIGYGAIHSRLTGRGSAPRSADHDTQTAVLGFWLALGGVILLLLMHGLGIWLTRLQDHKNLEGMEQILAGLGDAFRGDSWIKLENGWKDEMVWFLLLPLALNAFALCPIVIARMRRAWWESGARPRSLGQKLSLFGAAGITVVVLVYFGLIAAYNV
jgi:hypothetical protein